MENTIKNEIIDNLIKGSKDFIRKKSICYIVVQKYYATYLNYIKSLDEDNIKNNKLSYDKFSFSVEKVNSELVYILKCNEEVKMNKNFCNLIFENYKLINSVS